METGRRRRGSAAWAVVLTLSWMWAAGALAQDRSMGVKIGRDTVVVGHLEGKARIRPVGTEAWLPLQVGGAVAHGDEVEVGAASRLELVLPDTSRLRFDADTRFVVVQSPETEVGDVRIHMTIGRVWANVSRAMGVKRRFEISYDNAVSGVRGTVFRMNVHEDRSALVRVYEGEVSVSRIETPQTLAERIFGSKPKRVEGPKPIPGPSRITLEEWTVLLRSMQQVRIRPDGSVDQPRSFSTEEDRDEWVDWNKERDGR